MATSSRDDKAFISALIPRDLLTDAIDWISSNLSPEDVFGVEDLEERAKENGFLKEQ